MSEHIDVEAGDVLLAVGTASSKYISWVRRERADQPSWSDADQTALV